MVDTLKNNLNRIEEYIWKWYYSLLNNKANLLYVV